MTENTTANTYVEYDTNNSGGSWWLSDEDWKNLEKAGWEVSWKKKRWLGALATGAVRRGLSLEDAISEWESVTGQDPADEGCNCCGNPHNFTEYYSEDKHLNSMKIARNNTWSV
jgi:hypothetical protein